MAIWVVTQLLLIAPAHDMVLFCRTLIDAGVQAVQPLKCKQLLGAIDGQQCTSNTQNRDLLKKYCKEHGIIIWLPNGQDIGVGESCPKLPSLRPLSRPQSLLRCKTPRRQPHIYACHQPCRRPHSHCIPGRFCCRLSLRLVAAFAVPVDDNTPTGCNFSLNVLSPTRTFTYMQTKVYSVSSSRASLSFTHSTGLFSRCSTHNRSCLKM